MLKQTIIFAVVAGLVFALCASASAALKGQLGILDLTADPDGVGPLNAGENPGTGTPWVEGDTYHLVFVSSTSINGVSSAIADYNGHVQARADAEGIGTSVGVSWNATVSVHGGPNAIGNTSTTYTPQEPGYPVFRMDSAPVAYSYADLWDGGLSASISLDEAANVYDGQVWTASKTNGTHDAWGGLSWCGAWLRIGLSNATDSYWIEAWGIGPGDGRVSCSTELPLYAISQPLEIIPEPVTAALLLLGLPFVMRRKRR